MDLSTLKPVEEGQVMQVRHPSTGAPLDGMTITLLGSDSDKVRKARNANLNRRLKMGGRRGGVGSTTAEELEADGIEILVGATVAWTGVEVGGAALECSPENVRKVYREFPWLRGQADDFVGDVGSFLKG
jgi:hypothetical protein